MAYIDKTAHRLCRAYSGCSDNEMYDFMDVMKGINPFDYLSFYFNDSSYCKNEEELDKDREMKDGRWDPNVMTCDMLTISKVYSPEFRHMYKQYGPYTGTMDWPFVIIDEDARICDTEWKIHFFGPYNDLKFKTHIIGAPLLTYEEIPDPKDKHKILYRLYHLKAGEFSMDFRGNQLMYVEGCHQNAYDRGYPRE